MSEPQHPALTPRQNEVAARVARGETAREIARALFIGEGTVVLYVDRIRERLGIPPRHERRDRRGTRALIAEAIRERQAEAVRAHREAVLERLGHLLSDDERTALAGD